MITKIPNEYRYQANHGWLTSYHLFSFADYFDANNMNFGALRVFNDDMIKGRSGFGKHGHKNMEIITILLEGELTHEDTMGNTKVIRKGEVQYMSAGTGVMHSEINTGNETTHLYQIWIIPKKQNLTPTYNQKNFSKLLDKNTLTSVASNEVSPHAIHIQAEATISLGALEVGYTIRYHQKESRGVFIYITKGVLEINSLKFTKGDQARIEDENEISILAQEEAKFIFIDVQL